MPRNNNVPSLHLNENHRAVLNQLEYTSVSDYQLNKFVVVMRNGQLMTDRRQKIVLARSRAVALTNIRENLGVGPVFTGETINPYAFTHENRPTSANIYAFPPDSPSGEHMHITRGRATGLSIYINGGRIQIPFTTPLEFPDLLDETEPPWVPLSNRDANWQLRNATSRAARRTNRSRVNRFKASCQLAGNAIISELEALGVLRIIQYREYLQQLNNLSNNQT